MLLSVSRYQPASVELQSFTLSSQEGTATATQSTAPNSEGPLRDTWSMRTRRTAQCGPQVAQHQQHRLQYVKFDLIINSFHLNHFSPHHIS